MSRKIKKGVFGCVWWGFVSIEDFLLLFSYALVNIYIQNTATKKPHITEAYNAGC